LLFLAAMLAARPAGAVIVTGGYNNATQAGLDAYLAGSSQTAFPYWNNLVTVNSASGVYLGYNPSTMRGWVLTAQHVGVPSSITVAGNTYTVAGGTQIGSSDLRLLQIGGGVADPTLPLLPTVPIASAAASVGDFLLMFGRAYTSSTNAPYIGVAPGINDGMRWGTNTVELIGSVNIGTIAAPNWQPYLITDFDGPADPGVTAYDAQGSAGDSGGGLFIQRGGLWELSGIAHFVAEGSTVDGNVNPSQYGDFTGYTNVRSYASAIQSVTGTLVPEPSSATLLVGMVALLLHRRRVTRH
jgi:hypothetical protein